MEKSGQCPGLTNKKDTVELQLLRALLALVQGYLFQADVQITEAIHIAHTHQLLRLVTKAQQLHA